MDALVVAEDAQVRLLTHLDLGDQVAGARVPPGKLDACRLADQAASAVASDEVIRPQPAVGQLDVDAGVVLCKPRHLPPAVDPHGELVDPAGQDLLEAVLPQGKPVLCRVGKSLMSRVTPEKLTTCASCPCVRIRPAIPR